MRVLKYLRGKFKRTLFFVLFFSDSYYCNYISAERTPKQAKYYTSYSLWGVRSMQIQRTEPGNHTVNCCLVLRGKSAKLVNPGCLLYTPSVKSEDTRELAIILFITII